MRTTIENFFNPHTIRLVLTLLIFSSLTVPVQAHVLGDTVHVLAHEVLHVLPVLGTVAIIGLTIYWLRGFNFGRSREVRSKK